MILNISIDTCQKIFNQYINPTDLLIVAMNDAYIQSLKFKFSIETKFMSKKFYKVFNNDAYTISSLIAQKLKTV